MFADFALAPKLGDFVLAPKLGDFALAPKLGDFALALKVGDFPLVPKLHPRSLVGVLPESDVVYRLPSLVFPFVAVLSLIASLLACSSAAGRRQLTERGIASVFGLNRTMVVVVLVVT